MSDPTESWHLDKKVPVTLIVTIVLQTVCVVWWASRLSERQDQHERRIEKVETKQEASDARAAEAAARLARVEEKASATLDLVRQIHEDLRRR